MKRKNIFIILIATCLIFIVGGGFFFWNQPADTNDLMHLQSQRPAIEIPKAPEINLNPAPNEVIGKLHFPKLNVSVPLVYGYNEDYMEQYHDVVGLEAWNNFPGQDNKLYINGHRHLTFQNLKYLVVNDLVEIIMPYGTFTYQVVGVPQIVLATDKEAVNYYLNDHDTTFTPQILRLQTCYPFEAGSPLDHRYLVDLVLIESDFTPNSSV